RAFLSSYDPSTDLDGSILEGLLAAVIPVSAGVNLDYWFSYVDPARYGSGSKLPQNVSGLLGVMDGHASDLRTGLPWQMVELHEPIRLLTIVESTVERVRETLEKLPAVKRLVANRWVYLVALDPSDHALYTFGAAGFEPYLADAIALRSVPRSIDWYRGRREHLGVARIGSTFPPPPSKELAR
ncbi:MAG: DUF2309 family protein, partial [Polyangiaceae bacterium]|nr:DUF2309 family protein [Polyangiaceae bacterium]